jgi:hypothetical protein
MRMNVTLADDVATAVERYRRARGLALSEALNELVRAGLTGSRQLEPFRQTTHDLGDGIDPCKVADALDTLDGPTAI